MFGSWSRVYSSHIPSLVELGGLGGLPQLLKCILSVFGWRQPYVGLWILGPGSLESPYLGLGAIFFQSRKSSWCSEYGSNLEELFGYLAANFGVLLLVTVEAISETWIYAMKSGGSEAKKAKGAPTTSRYRRKLKLGESTHWAKSLGKTVRRRSPTN